MGLTGTNYAYINKNDRMRLLFLINSEVPTEERGRLKGEEERGRQKGGWWGSNGRVCAGEVWGRNGGEGPLEARSRLWFSVMR